MKPRAQSILEYVVVIGVVSAALAAMQLYLRRAVQSVVKITADQIGDQKKGVIGADLDYRYERSLAGDSQINQVASESKSTITARGGNVSYQADKTERGSGILQHEVWKEKNN